MKVSIFVDEVGPAVAEVEWPVVPALGQAIYFFGSGGEPMRGLVGQVIWNSSKSGVLSADIHTNATVVY